MKNKFFVIVLFIVFINGEMFAQKQSKADSILFTEIKKKPDCLNDWLAYRKMLVNGYFKQSGDTVLVELDILEDNMKKEVRLQKLRNQVVTFYYLTPANDNNTDEDERSWISVSLFADNYAKQVFNSDKARVVTTKYGRFSVHRFTLDMHEDFKLRKDFLLEQRYLGQWIIVQNKNPEFYPVSEIYFPPNIPKEESTTEAGETKDGNKILCTECKGKGETWQEVFVNCTSCLGKGSKKCSVCGGGGRRYSADRSKSEYCYKCNGTGQEYCYSCGGKGGSYKSQLTKCTVCKGKKFINK